MNAPLFLNHDKNQRKLSTITWQHQQPEKKYICNLDILHEDKKTAEINCIHILLSTRAGN